MITRKKSTRTFVGEQEELPGFLTGSRRRFMKVEMDILGARLSGIPLQLSRQEVINARKRVSVIDNGRMDTFFR